MAADYALAVDALLNEPTTIRIIGSPKGTRTEGFLTEAHRIFDPRKVIQILDPEREQSTISALGYQISEAPTAYICVGTACTAPITEPRQIAAEVDRMKKIHIRG